MFIIGFDRKRRIPYYYPHYGHFSGQMEADHDLEEMDGKFTPFSLYVKQTIFSDPLKQFNIFKKRDHLENVEFHITFLVLATHSYLEWKKEVRNHFLL